MKTKECGDHIKRSKNREQKCVCKRAKYLFTIMGMSVDNA